MYSITPSLKFRDFFYQPKMMLSSNCIPSIPLSTSSPRFRASKFTHVSVFPFTRTIRVPETHRRFSAKKRKILCFRHEEFSSGAPNPESVQEVLHEELEKVEVDKPNVDKRNLVSNLEEIVDAMFRVIGKPWTVPWTAETILQSCLIGKGLRTLVLPYWFKAYMLRGYTPLDRIILVCGFVDDSVWSSSHWVQQGITNLQRAGTVQPSDRCN